jgi:hypothetical protein
VWYDGFLWYDGRQKGVALCRWRNGRFTSDLGREYQHTANPYAGRITTFEPNVISIGEPAS